MPNKHTWKFYKKIIQIITRKYPPTSVKRDNDDKLFDINDGQYNTVLNLTYFYENETYLLSTQIWHNPFLRWNSSEYGGIETLQTSAEGIWVPDILVYNK